VATFAEFATKLDRLNPRLLSPEAQRRLASRVGVAAKRDVSDAVRGDLGGDEFMSGFTYRGAARKPVKFASGFTIRADNVVVLKPRPAGPWSVLEDGRKATRAPKAAGAKRRRRVATYGTPWGPRSYSSDRPLLIGPTQGKHSFRKASVVIARRTPDRVRAEVSKALREVF